MGSWGEQKNTRLTWGIAAVTLHPAGKIVLRASGPGTSTVSDYGVALRSAFQDGKMPTRLEPVANPVTSFPALPRVGGTRPRAPTSTETVISARATTCSPHSARAFILVLAALVTAAAAREVVRTTGGGRAIPVPGPETTAARPTYLIVAGPKPVASTTPAARLCITGSTFPVGPITRQPVVRLRSTSLAFLIPRSRLRAALAGVSPTEVKVLARRTIPVSRPHLALAALALLLSSLLTLRLSCRSLRTKMNNE